MNAFSGNSTDANCTEVLLSTDYADPDATINCKLTEEIFPKYLDQLQTCKENFPPYGRFVYSCSSMIIQYLLPTITISIAYYQIYGQLKVRLDQKMRQLQINATPASNGGPARPSTAHSNIIDRIESDIGRMRRTIHLLISVGLVFCVCWLPLNIVNAALDMTENERQNFDQQKQLVLYAICHACGMLSACANPTIYGFLNENFKAEFKELYQIVKSRICCCKCFNRANNNNQN